MGGAVIDTINTKFKKNAAALWVASALTVAPWYADAASLGKITVLSGLGEPLRAEIEIVATPAELAGMSARLANRSAFRDAGLEFAPGLLDLHFAIDKRSKGKSVIKVTSGKPVNEPFLDFLVELDWPSGPLVREYTFLLDPPELMSKGASRAGAANAKLVETVRGGSATPAPAAKPEPVSKNAGSVAPPPPAPKRDEATGGSTRVVQSGDTLRKIAGETRYEGVSLEQMLVALYRKNPDAFVGDNVNRLKTGAILTVPDKEAVAAVPPAEAKKVYVAQAADWNSYRQKLAVAAKNQAPVQEAAGQAASGKIAPKVDEPVSAQPGAKDQVKVSPTEKAAKGSTPGKTVSGMEEDLVAKDRALKEAQDRLAALEKNVADLQKLVDLKTQRLAELQQQASGKKEEPKAEPPKPADPAVAKPAPVEPAKPAEPVAKVAEPQKSEPVPAAAENAKPVEASPPVVAKPVEETKPVEPKPAAAQPAPPKKTAPPPPPEPELFDDPLPLIGGGGILALLLGYLFIRRRRKTEEPLVTTAIPAPSSLGPNSVFRMTGGQSVDTANVPVQTGEFSQTGPGTIDTDEVDPVAEADVYMAYGRDAQAEEILIEALRKDPHRTAIHGKLLEIYANRKSVKQFDTLASELYAQTGGVGAEWEKVAAMGLALDPENPLYSGARQSPSAEPEPLVAVEKSDAKATMVLPGVLGQMASGGESVEANDEAAVSDAAMSLNFDAVEEKPAASPDIGVLDFDLGIDKEQPASSTAPASGSASQSADTDFGGLDFDFGLDTSTSTNVAAHSETQASSLGSANDVSSPDLDFDATRIVSENTLDTEVGVIDFELDTGSSATDQTVVNPSAIHELTAEAAATMVNPDAVQQLGVMTGNDGFGQTIVNPQAGMDIGSNAEQTQVISPSAAASEDEEFDVKLNESVFLGRPMPMPDFDLTTINLDLAAELDQTQVVSVSEEPAGGVGAEPVVATDEVSTKMALAKAYEEMGDTAQARELLQEVIAEGGADLAAQAREVLARLPS